MFIGDHFVGEILNTLGGKNAHELKKLVRAIQNLPGRCRKTKELKNLEDCDRVLQPNMSKF